MKFLGCKTCNKVLGTSVIVDKGKYVLLSKGSISTHVKNVILYHQLDLELFSMNIILISLIITSLNGILIILLHFNKYQQQDT